MTDYPFDSDDKLIADAFRKSVAAVMAVTGRTPYELLEVPESDVTLLCGVLKRSLDSGAMCVAEGLYERRGTFCLFVGDSTEPISADEAAAIRRLSAT